MRIRLVRSIESYMIRILFACRTPASPADARICFIFIMWGGESIIFFDMAIYPPRLAASKRWRFSNLPARIWMFLSAFSLGNFGMFECVFGMAPSWVSSRCFVWVRDVTWCEAKSHREECRALDSARKAARRRFKEKFCLDSREIPILCTCAFTGTFHGNFWKFSPFFPDTYEPQVSIGIFPISANIIEGNTDWHRAQWQQGSSIH